MNISAEKLKKLREYHGWSQERLAEICGLSQRTISRIEKGEKASMETRLALATAFDITPAELCEDQDIVVGTGGLNHSGIAGLTISAILMYTQFYLPGTPFFDLISLLLTVGLATGMAAISMGFERAIQTIGLLRWVVRLPTKEVALQNVMPNLNRIIFYCYSAGALSSLVGIIAIFMTPANANIGWSYEPLNPIMMGVAIALLTLLYGAMLAELVFRPLKHQLERMLIEHHKKILVDD